MRILSVLHNGHLLVKKVTSEAFAEITKPLKKEAKKAGFKESEVEGTVRGFRKERR